MSDETNITAPRVNRIQEIILKDAALKEKLSGKMVPIMTRDKREKKFHKEAVDIVSAIHEGGGDAYTALKDDVLKLARSVLSGETSVVAAPPSSEPAKPAKEKGEKVEGGEIRFDQKISMISLLLSHISIAESHDKTPGSEERLKASKALLDMYTKSYHDTR